MPTRKKKEEYVKVKYGNRDFRKKVYWKPHQGPQYISLTRTEFEILYGGARGGGKTDAGIAFLMRWVHIPHFRALVIRRNSDDLKDWIDRAGIMYSTCGGRVVGIPPEVRFPSGAKIRTGHLKDEQAYTKYQGHEYQKMVIEELTQIPTEEQYLKLISSCRSTLDDVAPQVFCTTNPGGIGHVWVKNRFRLSGTPNKPILTKDPETKLKRVFIPARVTDNPTLMEKDPRYVDYLNGLKPTLRKAWRYGSWDIFAGQYFEEWNDAQHVMKQFPLPETWKRFRAYDHGYAKPACCKWYAVDYDGRVWVYKELYVTKWKIPKIAKKITKMSKGEEYVWSVADSSIFANTGEEETIADNFARHGITFLPSGKRRIDGWNLMRQYLDWNGDRQPKIIYFDNCKDSIRTIPALIHDEKHIEDLDSDGEDHAADADRYFLTTLRERKLEKQNPLDEQKTPAQIKLEMRQKQAREMTNFNDFYQ